MNDVIVSHAGRQHAYEVAGALEHAGLLETFFTSSYYRRDFYPDRLARLVPSLDRLLQKRHHPAIDARRVKRFPTLELPEIASRFVGVEGRIVNALVARRDERFDALVAERLLQMRAALFWGAQGSCLESLQAARSMGMATVAEMMSVPQRVSQALLERAGVPHEKADASQYSLRQEREPATADWCVVGSTFISKTLQTLGIPASRIHVIPLGVNLREFSAPERAPHAKLRVLFVGKLGRHKGLQYLLEAMRLLDTSHVELSLVGPQVGDEDLFDSVDTSVVRVVGPLEGAALHDAYASHDVFVLPSLYEGFGLVVLEAMAGGLPVIVSENSCAPDVVREGVDGFVVAPFDVDVIAARIAWCADNRERVREMGMRAAERAREFTWEAHGQRVENVARRIISGSSP